MIKVTLTNEILKKISAIDENRFSLNTIELPPMTKNKLRKNSKKKSSYASNKIEGNPLTEKQADEAIERDEHKHFLKPEQEIRNYFLALNFLEEKLKRKEIFSKEMILEVQAMVEKGASKDKIGLRGPMHPGVLFAVYDAATGMPDYIPPEYSDIPELLDELVDYVNTTDEYYESLQMGLPVLYYSGRENPPHPEIWVDYFLRMVELYSKKVYELSKGVQAEDLDGSLSYLNAKEKDLLLFLLKKRMQEFTPIDVSKMLGVTNKTIINRCVKLTKNGFIVPNLVSQRIRSYSLSEFTKQNEKSILSKIG